MTTQRIRFQSTEGTLDARLDMPAGTPRAYALFAHCFTCSKDTIAASRISGALADRGIAVFRFDFTGLGGSDGEFANTNFSSNIQDLLAAVDHLRGAGKTPSILIGHSLGGAAVLSAAAEIPETTAVVTIGAPSDPSHVQHLFTNDIKDIVTHGERQVMLAGRRFLIRKQFLEDIAEQKILEKVRELNRALLILHSPRDDMVNIEHARKIYEAALHPKSFISLDRADHLLTRKEDAEYVASLISAWATHYLAKFEKTTTPDDEPRTVAVCEAGDGKFAQHVVVGPHHLRGDEPVSHGGHDTGPSPYDLLLAALGTCTSMTLRMYAEHKGLPLESVEVELSHGKIHASDCKECETETGRIDKIDRIIRITGKLNDEQRKRLLEIADKCPVHKTLHSEVIVNTLYGE